MTTLFDVSWEVANMVGGIHTVLATKLEETQKFYGEDYVAIGPDVPRIVGGTPAFREEIWEPRLMEAMSRTPVHVRMGRWLVPGEPRALLVNYTDLYHQKDEILASYWETYGLDSLFGGWDYFDPVLFAHAAGMVIEQYYMNVLLLERKNAVAQAHEWMSAGAILYLKKEVPEVGTVFTTHATTLGRAYAGNRRDPAMYQTLDQVDPDQLARELNVVAKHSMEQVAARAADVFTTVSEITAMECKYLLGRDPEVTPNGIGDAFPEPELRTAEARQRARERLFQLAEVTTGDTYDRATTKLVLSSGRYEFTNKGLDVYLHALNELRTGEAPATRVIAFAACPAGHSGPRRDVLQAARGGAKPETPLACTHDLRDPHHDPIQYTLGSLQWSNEAGQQVHFIQLPIYLDGGDLLIPETYFQLLAGFDLTVFPSFYEPWGYTPLESSAFGVPSITSDLAGYGRWVAGKGGSMLETGVDVLPRDGVVFEQVVHDLAERMRRALALSDADHDAARAASLKTAEGTHWKNLIRYYLEAHEEARSLAGERKKEGSPRRFAQLARRSIVVAASTQGQVTAHMRNFVVRNHLPEPLKHLREIAGNLWWTWHPGARELFERLDPENWATHEQAGPLAFLEAVPQDKMDAAAESSVYLRRLETIYAQYQEYIATAKEPEIAYFCMEYGLSRHVRIYSGGLGVLAGDHLKSASDLNLPFMAVGLAYKEGYFRQQIDETGMQQSPPDVNDWERLSAIPVVDEHGARLTVSLPFPGRVVLLQAWWLKVGRIKLLLLDTDVEGNRPEDRRITDRLYGGDQLHRIEQEVVLGIGGYEMVKRMGIAPKVFHMNEGHSAFLVLARMTHLIQQHGLKYSEALDYVRHTTIFTTHTPVPAGHDRFDESLVRPFLAPFESALRREWAAVLRLGQGTNSEGTFGTTNLALRGALRVNGVSKIHGRVTRQMFHQEFPGLHEAEVPIGSITNGVHAPTWLAPDWQKVFSEEIDPDWRDKLEDQNTWDAVRDIDDVKVWSTHTRQRRVLIDWLRDHVRESWTRRRESPTLVAEVLQTLERRPLMIGFARRFAPYKRADLVFSDVDRLGKILKNPERPVVLVIGGKAHPADPGGKGLLQKIIQLSRDPRLSGHVIVVEGYDMDVASKLVAGVDVWLNTPTRPMEASGTSGMKAAMNGVMNLSVADGWWAEGYNGKNGWVIGHEYENEATQVQNDYDARALYALLEQEVAPIFYKREAGLPHGWVEMMRESVATSVSAFSTRRMVAEYRRTFYDGALSDADALKDDDFEGLLTLRKRKQSVLDNWSKVAFEEVNLDGVESGQVNIGERVPVGARLRHPGIAATDLEVQIVVSRGDVKSQLQEFDTVPMSPTESEDGHTLWQTEFACDEPGPHSLGLRVVPKGMSFAGDTEFQLDLVRWL